MQKNKKHILVILAGILAVAAVLVILMVVFVGSPDQSIRDAGDDDTTDVRVVSEPGAVEFKLSSPQEGQVVSPGQSIQWKIKAFVSEQDNKGLALFSVDLHQHPGNPELFDFSPGDRAPGGMAGFDRPAGMTNVVEADPGGSGYGGIPNGENMLSSLEQIGGAQNTFGSAPPCLGPDRNVCFAQDIEVDAGIGQTTSGQMVATGSFNAPDTEGEYTFFIDSVIANTLMSVNDPPAASEVRAAPVHIFKDRFSLTVSNGGTPLNNIKKEKNTSLPVSHSMDREVVILPREGALMNRLHVQFRWKPFDMQPAEYTLWIVEDNLQENPFNQTDFEIKSYVVDGVEPRTVVTSGLAFNTAYAWCVTDGSQPAGSEALHRFSTLEIPPDLPEFIITKSEDAGPRQSGYTLFGTAADLAINKKPPSWYLLFLNEADEIVCFVNTSHVVLSSERLIDRDHDGRNGRIFGFRSEIMEITLEGHVTWTTRKGHKAHHDVWPKPDGNYFTLWGEKRKVPIGDRMRGRKSDHILEFDRATKDIVWDWNALDYWSVTDGDGTWPEGKKGDWTHANAVVYDPVLNRVYVSSRHFSRVSCIDYATKDIIYNMGKMWDDTDLEVGFYYQHAPQLLPNGNMIIYDNGNLHDPPHTRAVEIAFEPDHIHPRNASIVWYYPIYDDAGEPIFLKGGGNARRLENGNTIFPTHKRCEIWEVDMNKKLVRRLKLKFTELIDQMVIYRVEHSPRIIIDTPGDSDGDWDLDMVDFAQLQVGFTGQGPGMLHFPYTLSDHNKDGSIDIQDVHQFVHWMTGPGLRAYLNRWSPLIADPKKHDAAPSKLVEKALEDLGYVVP